MIRSLYLMYQPFDSRSRMPFKMGVHLAMMSETKRISNTDN